MRRACQTFAASIEGQTATVFALLTIPLMGFIGMGVDGARWYQGRQATSQAIDSAVLMAARKMQLNGDDSAGALDAARRTYLANVVTRTIAARDTVDFELADNNTAIVAKGDAVMKTSFLSVVGVPELPLFSASAGKGTKATFLSGLNQGTDIELSMVLDFTGSMCDSGVSCSSGTKVQGLRDAAKELVGIVVSDIQSTHSSRIALVPFSSRIRVASDSSDGTLMEKLTGLAPTWSGYQRECTYWSLSGGGFGEGGQTWTCTGTWQTVMRNDWKILPCVTERLYGNRWDADDTLDYSDREPGNGYWLNAHGGDRAPFYGDSSQDYPKPANSAAQPSDHWNYAPSAYCHDVPESNVVVPLSSDKDMLRSKIDSFSAGGSTAGPLGTAFGWYTLSPNWETIWPSDSKPASYSELSDRQPNGAPKLRKVAVIMTDGVYNTMRGNNGLEKNKVAKHARDMCRAMKDKGIEIYTVGFALDELPGSDRSTAENMLKDCGSSVQHFYSTLNVTQLKDAFRDIALRVTPVRLTQ